MRKAILVRGPSGSGKSSFIRKMGWEPWFLSQDQIRLLRRGPALTDRGVLAVPGEDNEKVFKEFIHRLADRAERGEFLVVESVFDEFNPLALDVLRQHDYAVACLDFFQVPLPTVQAGNLARPEWARVPAHVIDRQVQRGADTPWGRHPDVTVVPFHPDGRHEAALRAWRDEPVLDIDSSRYRAITHIGDLQGCLSVLIGPGGPLEYGFRDDTLYVFVGDLLDRGIENGKLLRWFIDTALPRDNVMLIRGNHEVHLSRWGRDLPAVSDEFAQRTLPQLKAAGITRDEARQVIAKARDIVRYTYAGHQVMVTHAGLPTVPADPVVVPSRQYEKGTGYWSDPVDQQFDAHAPAGWVQVHGHRNHGFQAIQATPRSFSLEEQVEFGGRLRWATLTPSGWSTGSVRNPVFEVKGMLKHAERALVWPGAAPAGLDPATLTALRAHKGVKERPQGNGISSFNFTKDVFFSASWDDVSARARGLFVQVDPAPAAGDAYPVLARGYDKFFNVNERPDTQLAALARDLAFPVTAWVKENGFLGLVGYDPTKGGLLTASKSSTQGDFADLLRRQINDQLDTVRQEALARFLRDNDACLSVEVIAPVEDSHIIEYDSAKLIVLDMIRRSGDGARLPYDELVKLTKRFGLETKQRGPRLPDGEALTHWHDRIAYDLSFRHRGQDIEGFVLEDAAGRQAKIKLAHYAFWKRMRSVVGSMASAHDQLLKAHAQDVSRVDRANRGRVTGGLAPLPLPPSPSLAALADTMRARGAAIHPVAEVFLPWAAQQGPEAWKRSIIDLRNAFLAAVPTETLQWHVPFDPYGHGPVIVSAAGTGENASPVASRGPKA